LDLRSRLEQVRSRIAAAAARAGRSPAEITLVAVTKVFPASAIRESYELGVRDFGEAVHAVCRELQRYAFANLTLAKVTVQKS